MSRKILFLAALLITMIPVAGCAPRYRHLEVISKEYIPAHTTFDCIPTEVNGQTLLIPKMIREPERWTVKLRSVGEEKNSLEFSVNVNQKTYDSWQIGQTITNPDDLPE